MYLKSLKLTGFKSFADSTRLEFRPGVTVVVGPNGVGKSNLVDALSWVLGTQSTKTLRTEKMEDLIFAGTATRPSLGKAEVTLVVDNAERMIGLDLDEISITRRLYRDGSSDYELNGVNCRLLDIQDLLSDSGVGRHQHVIIGQGEIGTVLNASPEEHRAVIEEAAGILKHRRRKERSERRLERTDEDLDRLHDLLGEIGRQMRPLRRQARAAERYDGLKSEVTALGLYLGGKALARHDRDLTVATSEKSRLHETLDVDRREVEDLSTRLAALTERAKQVGVDLDRETSAAATLETTVERLRRVASVAHERNRAVSGRREAAVERLGDLENEKKAISEEIHSIDGDRRDAMLVADTAERRFRWLEDEERAVATQNALSPEGALAAARGELGSLDSAQIRDDRERVGITHRLEVLASQRRDETAEVDRINGEIKKIDEEIFTIQVVYDDASAQRATDQEAWSTSEETRATSRLAVASADARVEAIKAGIEGGYDAEARQLVEGAKGVVGTLISQLDIPEGMEAAVDTALGRWVTAVAFEDVDAVRNIVESVKGSGGGSVSVVSAMSEGSAPAKEVAKNLGVEALISRLGPRAHQGLATRLLGDVVLVEGWVSGWDLIAKYPALRAVTPEGDLISVSGVHIANPDGAGVAMLETAEVALEKSSTALARAESIYAAARHDLDASRQVEMAALERLESAEAGLAGRSEAMWRLQKSVDSIEEEQARLEERKAALTDSIDQGQRQITELRSRLQALEGEEGEQMRVWDELEARRLQLAADREVARSEWQDATGKLRSIVERERLLQERLARIDVEVQRLEPGHGSEADQDRLATVENFAQRAVSVLKLSIEELRDRQTRLRIENEGVLADLGAVRDEHDSLLTAISNARERSAELDVRIAELRLHREAVVESIRRDADSDVDAAMGAPRPERPEDTNFEELLESRRAQLSRLGPINPLAAEEFRELDERHTFLSDQMSDIESSRSELRKVITALEEEIELRFQAAFSEVAEAYERYFGVLFPGGRGQLRVIDPDDTQSGVVIDAQPLGKKVSQMTLLSGGERSLAALAFLFAVFEARPSPFYVLDEVEAALDATNLRRFLRVVDEFKQRAQLLIVTHQQQTMEAADVLYGVTMEPGGSSQAIRKDMTIVVSEQVA
ncbi:MAG: chromosome segregation protein SMC [Acidobacteria bacterium]|nr:chromosome segregation protein SMC [Acidobacteriota bacterium]